MFSTMHGTRIDVATNQLSNDPQIATLMNKHGARKFWAAVKAQGLEPQDVDGSHHMNHADYVTVHPKVPEAAADNIRNHRIKTWEDLRQSRLRDVEMCMENLSDDDVRRYWKCEKGVNPVDPRKDLPPVDQLGGMEKFNQMQAAHHAQVKAEQTRKATQLGLDFLMDKKKRDDADAKVAAFEKRIADYKKAQADENKARVAASQKKFEKRQQDAARAAQARAAWEDETEAALWERFSGANSRRTIRYSPDTLSAKLEANKQKRLSAFLQAREIEEATLQRIEDRRIREERRLEQRRLDNEEKVAMQRAESQANFQHRQVVIYARTKEWVDNKLSEHAKYKDKCAKARDDYKNLLKERSKFTRDTRDKFEKLTNQNKEKLANQRGASDAALLARHAAADERREELAKMKLKCDNDIYSYTEIKHHTFGELGRRRNAELKRRADAKQQAMIYDLAERQAKMLAQSASAFDLRKARQQISKESLTFQDNANEGFLKIQSEPDENKVIATMNALGFDMPKLPEKDDDIEEDDKPKAAF